MTMADAPPPPPPPPHPPPPSAARSSPRRRVRFAVDAASPSPNRRREDYASELLPRSITARAPSSAKGTVRPHAGEDDEARRLWEEELQNNATYKAAKQKGEGGGTSEKKDGPLSRLVDPKGEVDDGDASLMELLRSRAVREGHGRRVRRGLLRRG